MASTFTTKESQLGEEQLQPVLSLIPSHRSGVDDETLHLAAGLIDSSGVLERMVGWKAEERRGPGGRPETFPVRALLVVMVACALTDQPLYLTRFCEVMFVQLSPEWRRRLGIFDPPDERDEAGRKRLYRNVRTRFHRILDLMDPSPTPKNRRLDDATFTRLTEQRQAERTEEQWSERYLRLEWVINQLIEASIKLLSREVRRAMGSLGVGRNPGSGPLAPLQETQGDQIQEGREAQYRDALGRS